MFNIPIYKSEANDGLTNTIRSNNSIACYSPAVPVKEINIEKLKTMFSSFASSKFDLDILYPTKSVLVTSNWNRNDDIFGSSQIWCARKTPVHKPTNINHDHKQIVGHITDTWVIDSEGNILDEDTLIDDLPETIHICNGAVIYKHYKDEELTNRAMNLIEEIEAGTKYVSMECLFPDFDYAVISPDNKSYVVNRNEQTAFLTKHLRVYGGKGSFNGYKVGRYIKNMIFSGKGYVDEPANPNSIIFTEDKPDFSFSAASYKNDFVFENGVTHNYSGAINSTSDLIYPKETIMAENNDFYKSQVEKLEEQVATLIKEKDALEAKIGEANVESFKSTIEDLKSQVANLNKEKSDLEAKLQEKEETEASLNENVKTLTEQKAALEEEIAKAEAEKIFADRVSSLVEAGVEKEKAEETVAKFENLNEEQFAEIVAIYAAKKADMKKDEKMKTKKEEDSKAEQTQCSDNAEELENVEIEDSEAGVGATESDDSHEATAKVRESIAKYFAESFGQASDE